MNPFRDRLLLRFGEDAFVQDLLVNGLGLETLFGITYETADLDVRQVSLAEIGAREYARPAFETLHTSGVNERIVPSSERVRIDRSRPREGRLAWVDVSLGLRLNVQSARTSSALERITAEDLRDKLGSIASLDELRVKLEALYPASIVAEYFKRTRITTLDDFQSRPALFLEFIGAPPEPFDPGDPQTLEPFLLEICVQMHAALEIGAALREAKLCRSVLESERLTLESTDDRDVLTPYVFVVLFPDAAVAADTLPGMTAAQVKAATRSLFRGERMLAHFV